MATIRVVPKSDWEVIQKYFSEGCGAILLPEPCLEKYYPEAMAKALIDKDGEEVDYDFGGDPDFMVDIVSAPSHWAIDKLMEGEGDSDE